MNFKLISALAAAGLLSAAPAIAETVSVDFEGVTTFAAIDNYYNGGSDEAGAFGPNLGITFRHDALALTNEDGGGTGVGGAYFTNAPSPGTIMFAAGADAAMSSIGFSKATFYYSATEDTTVQVFSGSGGKGDLLGTFTLLANAQNGCTDSPFCFWGLATIEGFAGVAHSLQFGTTFADGASLAAFDDVEITPVPLPAAGWLLLSALGGLGTWARRKVLA